MGKGHQLGRLVLDGHQRVVRHGHLPEREVMTGIGPVAVRQPRVRDREADATVHGGDKVFHWSGGDLRPRRSKIQPVVRRSFVLWTKGSRRDVCRGSLRGGSAICFQ